MSPTRSIDMQSESSKTEGSVKSDHGKSKPIFETLKTRHALALYYTDLSWQKL